MSNHHTHSLVWESLLPLSTISLFLAIFLRWFLYTLNFEHHWHTYCYPGLLCIWSPFPLFLSDTVNVLWWNWFPRIYRQFIFIFLLMLSHVEPHIQMVWTENGNSHFVWLHIILMSFSASTNHILKFKAKWKCYLCKPLFVIQWL